MNSNYCMWFRCQRRRADTIRNRRSGRLILIMLICLSALGIGIPVAVTSPSGVSMLAKTFNSNGNSELLTFEVTERDLEVKVLATGLLESASTLEVLSEVEGKVGIIKLLPRGTLVKQGDVVVELDSSLLKTSRIQQRVIVEQSKAATAQAKEALQIAKSQAESDIQTAELVQRFAHLDLRKYTEGDYPQEQRTVASEITLAEEDLKRANDRIGYSKELKVLGYLSDGQVDADKLVVLRSEVALKLAKEKQQLLEKFTHSRMKQDFESKVEESKRSLSRSKSLAQAMVEQAETKLKVQQATQELEESKLTHIDDQIKKCSLIAPQDGVVLYPVPEDEDEPMVKPGALVRQQQHVFTLPNTEKLKVSASVHEASVRRVKPGKSARIWIDALPDRVLEGKVEGISKLPDLQSWRKSTVNFYPAEIAIEGSIEGLRPGMNTKVEILYKKLESVLAIPVQAVIRSDDDEYCYVKNADGQLSARKIELGKSNDEYVEVEEGLSAGDQVVISPDQVVGIDFKTESSDEEA